MENNKVKVKIFGQEYVISGEEAREHILRVADYVDSKMNEIEKSVKTNQLSLIAVLSAVNIADGYFSILDTITELKKTNAQLEKDVEHYIQLWEDAKKSFLQYKEDAQAVSRKKDTLKNTLDEKEQELSDLKNALEEANSAAKKEVEAEIAKLNDKIRENESSFFDLQMENVQLKSELERYKKVKLMV